jgi:hypothetical protein
MMTPRHIPRFMAPARQNMPAARGAGHMLPAKTVRSALKLREKFAATGRHGSC